MTKPLLQILSLSGNCLPWVTWQTKMTSVSFTYTLSPAADWQEIGTLIKFRSISQSSLYADTKRRTCNRSQAPLYVFTALTLASKHTQNITGNLCQPAAQTVTDPVRVYHLYPQCGQHFCSLLFPAAQTQVQMSSWQFLAASLWVYF